jgi:hypothetical protein
MLGQSLVSNVACVFPAFLSKNRSSGFTNNYETPTSPYIGANLSQCAKVMVGADRTAK